MCGIAGMLLFPTERSEEELQSIRNIFTQTLISNEERGREASGVALIQRDGSFQLFKQPVPASELVEMEPYRNIMTAIGSETTSVLGHTRMPTKGDPRDNDNNHPLRGEWVIGVHNGQIHNDDDLFQSLDLPRRGEVDSEIIFRMLDTLSPQDLTEDYLGAVRRQAEMLYGVFATLSVDLRKPEWLVVMKHEMPLSVHYHVPWQTLFFSSRYLFLRKAFGQSIIGELLTGERTYLFDATLLPKQGSAPVGELTFNRDYCRYI